MVSSESVLPDNTTLLVVADDAKLILDEAITSVLAETEVAEFIDTFIGDESAIFERLGIRLVDLMSISSGELSLGYVRSRIPSIPGHTPATPLPPAFFLTMDISGNEADANAILDAAIERLVSMQFKKRAVREQYRSVCHLQISASDAKTFPGISSRDRAFSIHKGMLFAVDKMPVAQSIADNLTETTDSALANSQAFVAVMNACNGAAQGARADLRWFTVGNDSSSDANGGYLLREGDRWRVIERSIRDVT